MSINMSQAACGYRVHRSGRARDADTSTPNRQMAMSSMLLLVRARDALPLPTSEGLCAGAGKRSCRLDDDISFCVPACFARWNLLNDAGLACRRGVCANQQRFEVAFWSGAGHVCQSTSSTGGNGGNGPVVRSGLGRPTSLDLDIGPWSSTEYRQDGLRHDDDGAETLSQTDCGGYPTGMVYTACGPSASSSLVALVALPRRFLMVPPASVFKECPHNIVETWIGRYAGFRWSPSTPLIYSKCGCFQNFREYLFA